MSSISTQNTNIVKKYLKAVFKARLNEKKAAVKAYLKGNHKKYELFEAEAHEFYDFFGCYDDRTSQFKQVIKNDPTLSKLLTEINSSFFTKEQLDGHDLQCTDANGVHLTFGDKLLRSNELGSKYPSYWRVCFKYGQPALDAGCVSMSLLSDTCKRNNFVKV